MKAYYHRHKLLLGVTLSCVFLPRSVSAFSPAHLYSVKNSLSQSPRQVPKTCLWEVCNNDHGEANGAANGDDSSEKRMGDPLRDATGIRPSLHPTTINALARALKIKATHVSGDKSLTVDEENGISPLDVAIRAGQIATDAIDQRQSSSNQDGMTLTPDETQTIAGRVVGVVMRLEELETMLNEKVHATSWIAKFGDWDSFGVLPDESDDDEVRQRIQMDPLFTMTRAECLLGLFLKNIEIPQLTKAGQSVPDQGQVDFLDEDRKEVLAL
ncbi:expressed unknown protein [Seminavis robusta]|uniref:Uncharacterized protein n=1 Tax=Seminavis robusta TaxID=568900 RepID=A0A9N8HBM9_9STRA|nr:expressed unknown protein [Seminavis robusta]|eukprot:Sro267_g103340.1 n/a (270) ;mRNA; r:16736-17545